MATRFAAAPSLAEIESLAAEAYRQLPAQFRRLTGELLIRVEDFPDKETEEEMGLDTPFDLLGLYRGVDLTRKSLGDIPQEPDLVFLYRRAILDYWAESGEDLPHIVRHVLIHEIGHHFGLSDDDMERIEEG
jgi:predicted Zn-dependent protease with MMP-like domain